MSLYDLLLDVSRLFPEAEDQAEHLVQIEEALHWIYGDTCREHGISIAEAHKLAKDTDEWERKLIGSIVGGH